MHDSKALTPTDWLLRLVVPPLLLPAALLITRLLLHHSHWGLVPICLMLIFVSTIGSIMLSAKFLLGFFGTVLANRNEVVRFAIFFAWIAVALGIGIAGTNLVNSLPIPVGDGP